MDAKLQSCPQGWPSSVHRHHLVVRLHLGAIFMHSVLLGQLVRQTRIRLHELWREGTQ
jgi:hypothetical protein